MFSFPSQLRSASRVDTKQSKKTINIHILEKKKLKNKK